MKRLKKQKNAIAIGLIITFLALGLINPQNKLLQDNISKIEGIIYDLRLNSTLPDTPRKSSHNIFIVDIDEKALDEVGRWPWSRSTVAKLVEQLKEAGVVVVGFDVVFSEPEINPVDTLTKANALDHLSVSELADLRLRLDADTQFAQTIADYDVVLGGLLQDDKSVDVGTLKASPIVMLDPRAVRVSSMHFAGKVANVEVLQEAAISQGFFNSAPDVDGALRRAALVFEHNGVLYPSLSIEIARIYELADEVFVETKPSEAFEGAHDISAIKFGTKRRIKTDAYGRVLIPYRGGQKSFPYYSATDILHGRVDPELLEGGVALVGTSAVGIADLRETSVGIQYPGVEVHANVVDGLLNPELFKYRPVFWEGAVAVQIIIWGLILSLVLPFVGPMSMAVWGLVSIVFIIGLNFYLWQIEHIDIPIIQALIVSISISMFNIARGFFSENANKQRIKSMFDQYVPPAHIDQMLSDPSSASLKGDRREMSVLFSDIRSFTSISEKLSANELKDMLNEYFSPITKSIFENEGTIDKYVGDMVMAFWGAPIENPNHAELSVIGGFDMLKITAHLREEFTKKDWPAVRVGIGINTGEMNVGDMGSEYRRAYTVLGDAVNLGARLEGLTKFYGLEFLVSEFTRAQCPNVAFRPIDKVKVKGKDLAVAIFEPVCMLEDLDEVTKIEIEELEVAYQDYLDQNWDSANQKYSALLNQFPERYLYKMYIERIEQLRGETLGDNWDGSFTHTSK